jgi:hypothetical protein
MYGKDPVAVDQLEIASPFAGDAFIEGGIEEAWEVVGDDGACLFSECLHEGVAITAARFDVSEIGRILGSHFASVIAHAIDNKLMESIAGPGIADLECFEDEERTLELDREFDGPLQGEIRMESSMCDHPVKDEMPVRLDRLAGAVSDADRRNLGSHWTFHG